MAALAEASVAPVKWAQRPASLYITISLPDVKDEKIELTATALTFSGTSHGRSFTCNMEFLHAVKPEDSVWKVLPRSIQMNVVKEAAADGEDEEAIESWTRLLKDKQQEKTNVKVDWDRWADSDDEDEAGAPGGGQDFDMSQLAGAEGFPGGMGGMGGMPGGGMGGMPPGMEAMMGGMGGGMGGGMPGMGGGDEWEGSDSDDDELPDLDADDDDLPPLENADEVGDN